MFWFTLFTALLFFWLFTRKVLGGPDLKHLDTPVGEKFAAHADDAQITATFLSMLADVRNRAHATKSIKQGFRLAREFTDNLSQELGLDSDCSFTAVTANGVNCEWALAPGADPDRRILFLHGGAFLLGSPRGHRIYSHRLSHIAKAAVLSVDYRMMPENKRILATVDAQSAYHWIIDNGPAGADPANLLLVAGDSAGGNLALMLSGWSKTSAARKPDGVIAFSPSVDTTLAAPSFKSNRATDPLLGPALGFLTRLPKTLSLWFGLFSMRARPANKLLSPLFGDLDNLPPTLIQASNSEVLVGDAIRYTNKAKAANSDVTLQLWADQVHDWQLFSADSGSGKQAWDEVAKFISRL